MAGNLTAILPLEDFSFSGLVGVSYLTLFAALIAFPAVLTCSASLYARSVPLVSAGITDPLSLASTSRQESPSSRFPLDINRRLRHRV